MSTQTSSQLNVPSAGLARILVAEDETLIRMDLVEMLNGAGYQVVGEAKNGEEAIALAHELKPDLAILDVKMPVLDGISAAEEIISISPVLMLTAFSQKELVDRARDAGVMAYVCLLYTSPSPRDRTRSRMPSSA